MDAEVDNLHAKRISTEDLVCYVYIVRIDIGFHGHKRKKDILTCFI
jgi:hypothetical protein